MNKPVTIRTVTAALDAETAQMLERLASARDMSVEEFAAMAITVFAQDVAADDAETDERWKDPAFRAFVQEGIDAADSGDFVPHEVVMAELRAMVAKHKG